MLPLKLLVPVTLAIAMIASVNGDIFSTLTAEQKTNLIDAFSGSAAPSVIQPSVSKGVVELRKVLKKVVNDTAYQLIASQPLLGAAVQAYLPTIFTSIDSLSKTSDLFSYNSTVNGLISSANIAALTTAYNALDINALLFSVLNLDTYQLNLANSDRFWTQFDAAMTSNPSASVVAAYNTLKSSVTPIQIIALAVSIEIPATDAAKNELFLRFFNTISKRATFLSEFEQALTTPSYQWSFAQIQALEPLLKDMACFYLRKVNFTLLYTNWLNVKSIDLQILNKLAKCNMGFVAAAAKLAQTTALPLATQGVFGDYIVKYALSIGVTDVNILINYAGNLLGNIPASTLQMLLDKNVNAILQLFTTYNVQTTYYTFSAEWRNVIAKIISKYLLTLTRAMNSNELQMFTTAVLDMPFDDAIRILDANNNYQQVLPLTDATPISFWLQNRDLCNRYFDYLVSKAADPLVTTARLVQLIPCKKGCDFTANVAGLTTAQIAALARQYLPKMDPAVVCSCRNSLGKYLKMCAGVCTQNEVVQALNNFTIPLCSVFTTNELPSSVLGSIAADVAKGNVDQQQAVDIFRQLVKQGASIPMAQFAKLASAFSIDYIKTVANKDIYDYSAVILQYCSAIDQPKLALVLQKYLTYAASQGTIKTALLNILNTKNTDCYNAIDLTQFKSASLLSSDMAKEIYCSLPPTLFKAITPIAMASLDISNAASYCLNHASVTDLAQLLGKSGILTLLANLNTNNLDYFKLKSVSDAVFAELVKYNITNPFAYLTDPMVDQVEPLLFVALSSGNLTNLAQSPVFPTILKKIVKALPNRCLDFPADKVREFIEVAVKQLGLDTKASWSATDLDSLGAFLVVRLPLKYLKLIDPQALFSRIEHFHSACFQLSASDAAAFSTYLDNAYKSQKVSLSMILELAVYLPTSTIQSLQTTEIAANIQDLLKAIQTRKDNFTEIIKNERKIAGLTALDDKDIIDRINNLVNTIIQKLNSSPTGRRKRLTGSLDCTTIKQTTANGYGATAYTISDLTSLLQADFESCLSIFGSTSINWNNDYVTAFYNKLKGYYSNLSLMPSTVISDMGVIAYKFSASELQQLTLSTLEPVLKLGSLSGFTSDQAAALVTAMKSSGQSVTTAATLGSMGNLVCGVSSTDMASVTVSTFNSILSTLSVITATNCANLNSWWTLAKQSYSPNSIFTTTNIGTVGSIAAGMSLSEFNTNINTPNSVDLLNSFSNNALSILSADIKNAIKSNPTLLAALDSRQQASMGLLDKAGTVLSSVLPSSAYSTIFNPFTIICALSVAAIMF